MKKYLLLTISLSFVAFSFTVKADSSPYFMGQVSSSTPMRFVDLPSYKAWVQFSPIIVVPKESIVSEIHTPKGETVTIQKVIDAEVTCYVTESKYGINTNCLK